VGVSEYSIECTAFDASLNLSSKIIQIRLELLCENIQFCVTESNTAPRTQYSVPHCKICRLRWFGNSSCPCFDIFIHIIILTENIYLNYFRKIFPLKSRPSYQLKLTPIIRSIERCSTKLFWEATHIPAPNLRRAGARALALALVQIVPKRDPLWIKCIWYGRPSSTSVLFYSMIFLFNLIWSGSVPMGRLYGRVVFDVS
jgi:hypothetical protein